MQDSWKKVETLIDEMRKLLLLAGIPERQITMPTTDPDNTPAVIPLARYNEIYDWLHMLLMSDEWAMVVSARQLVPDSVWDYYQLHDIKGQQEQLVLEKHLVKLRKRWKQNRPSFFGRCFKAKGSKSDGDETRGDE